MNALGKHILLELKDCNREALNDVGFLRDTMLTAANDCGATVLGESFHPFNPQGVSGVVVIAESHLSIHTWPEYGYAAVDIFTCGNSVQPEKAATVLIKKLDSKNHSLIEIQRGLLVEALSGVG
ncbi:adenosylmethionine decarboxylase [Chloroflexota bacterium]